MKTIFAVLVAVAVAVPATWMAARRYGAVGPSGAVSSGEGRRVLFNQSPMHPWVKSDKPGSCTICGMALSPIYEGEGGIEASSDGLISLSSTQIRVAGVQTAEVKAQPLVKTLRVAGQIDDDVTRHRFLSAYSDGRVDRLYVNFAGAEVAAGEPLAEIYSPTLLQAEREFRQLTGELRQRSALRLRQLGLMPAQIEAVPQKDPNALTSQILAPYAGTVVAKFVFEGQYVREGEKLFELADFSTMWFVFPAYEQDLPWLELGQRVDVTTPSRPGQTFSGPISFIDPNLDEATRATSVRIELPNPVVHGRRHLLHRLYADGTARIEGPPVLAVPRSAVIETGAEAVAYVDEGGGGYRRARVTLGRRGDHLIEVLDGLKEGQRVVTSGNLLIDGQSEMNRQLARPEEPAASPQPSSQLTFTADEARALAEFVQFADTLATALAADDLTKFDELALLAVPRTESLSKIFAGRREQAEPLARVSSAARSLAGTSDLAAARTVFHTFIGPVTALLEPVRNVAGVPVFALFECAMVDEAIPGAPPKARWVQAAGRPAANPFFGSRMPDCATEIKP